MNKLTTSKSRTNMIEDGIESFERFVPDIIFFRVTKGDKTIELLINQKCFDFYRDLEACKWQLDLNDAVVEETTKVFFFDIIHRELYGAFVSSYVYERFHM